MGTISVSYRQVRAYRTDDPPNLLFFSQPSKHAEYGRLNMNEKAAFACDYICIMARIAI
jgi:hypothetical protein